MRDQPRSLLSRILVSGALVTGIALLHPVRAEAQARGTLQVFAQVVDIKASSEGLQAARSAVRQVGAGAAPSQVGTVSTLAQVSVARAQSERSELVVTIDYSK